MRLEKLIQNVETGKDVPVDLQEIIKSRALLQANSGGGKSHIIRKFCEKSHGKVQQIIIDPEGEFHTLREKYEYLLVAKGPQADIQIEPSHAALLAKKLMETGADAILDLYELNPAERIRFVKLFVDALVNLPKNLWHPCIVIIDEIHTFAPESKSGRSESLAAVSSLASRGRKRGYALVGATQRISKLNKDVAAELNTKFIGRCSVDIDRKRAGEELGFKDTTKLRKLKHEFYAFGPAISNDTILIKAYKTETSSDELGSTSYIPANKGKIQGLLQKFTELPQEAELDLKTKEGLQLKVQELQTKLRVAERQQPKQDPEVIDKAYQKGILAGEKQSKIIIEGYKKYVLSVKANAKKIEQTISTIIPGTKKDFDLILLTAPNLPESAPRQIPQVKILQETFTDESANSLQIDSDVTLNKCAETCLKKLVEFNKPLTRKQLAVYSGYSSKSGGFSSAVKDLRDKGFIEENGTITPTQAGINQAGGVELLPQTHEDLLRHWSNKLAACPAKLLEHLCTIYPEKITREELAIATEYSPSSGGFSSGVKMLRDLGLATESSGTVSASEEMYP